MRCGNKGENKSGGGHTLVKSDDRITTGVCAGIAQYFDVDTIIVRIAFIILLICSYGLMLIPYCALAVTLPYEVEKERKPIDVAPAAIESDIYSHVVQASDIKTSTTQSYGINAGIAHVPPSSPIQMEESGAFGKVSGGMSGNIPGNIPGNISGNMPGSMPGGKVPSQRVLSVPVNPSATQRSVVAATLVIALTALFILVAKMLVSQISEFSLIGFFPLLFIVVGTICLVCFAAELSLGMRILCLVLCVELCMACLPFTTGLCSLHVLSHIGVEVWLLLGAVLLIAVIGIVKRRTDMLMVAMCVFALALMLLYLEADVFERIQAMSTYSRHNLTSPLFRRDVS